MMERRLHDVQTGNAVMLSRLKQVLYAIATGTAAATAADATDQGVGFNNILGKAAEQCHVHSACLQTMQVHDKIMTRDKGACHC